MTLQRIRGLLHPACLTAATFVASLLPATHSTAQDRSAAIGRVRMNASRNSAGTAQSQLAEIRLQHIAANWSRVLEQVAADSGRTLVMHDVPPGRFTRNDIHKHTLDDTLRILNRDLEPLGFRAIANDEYLTVIRAERARAEYPRRELDTDPAQSRANDPYAGGVQTAGYQSPADRPAMIQRTGGESSASTDGPARSAPTTAGRSAGPLVTTQLSPRNRPAIEISRDIYAAFEDRSTVQEQGPHGLPAFTVWRDAPEETVGNLPTDNRRGEWFILELDTAENAVVINAAAEISQSVSELIRRLDAVPRTEGETTRVVAGGRELPEIGKQLRPQIDKLKTDGRPQPRRVAWQGNAQPGADAPADQGPPGVGAPFAANDNPLMGNLRGDVQIQSVDDLNLLILTGNEADVQQVLEVIDLIERMAQGSQPEIHLLNLQHVGSEALAELLTDIYERLGTQQEGMGRTPPTVNVVPVVQPNAILILAPEAAMESILALAQELDKPADPAAEVHVYRLKHAIASQVVTLLEDFYEDRPGLGTRVRAIADARTNSVIIQARPRELDEVELLIKQIDKDTTGATHQARVIPLKHASAGELAEFLNTAVQSVLNPSSTTGQTGGFGGGGAGQNSQQLRDTKSVVLEFLQTNGDVKRLVKSGLLTDIRFSGDPRTNTLLITAPKDSLPMLEALVGSLDQPSNAVASVRMIPLKSADAVAAVDLLTQLFEPQQEDQLGVQLAGAETTSSLVPLRFQADARSNTVIAYGSEDALVMVEAILLRLDNGNLRDRQQATIKLRNAPAADVASAINTFLQSQRDLLQLDPDRVSTFELLEQEIVVTPDPVNNYLLISATPKYFDRIMEMVRQLDSDPPQVMIQALLVEVELDDTDEFGIELGFQDPLLFARSFTGSGEITTTTTTTTTNNVTTTATNVISQSATPGFLFNGDPTNLGSTAGLGNGLNSTSTPNASRVGTQGLTNFALGRASDLGYGGFVFSASSNAVSVLMRALQACRKTQILARPTVTVVENQQAFVQSGFRFPRVTGSTVTQTGVVQATINQDLENVGVLLLVTPYITENNEVSLIIDAERSDFSTTQPPIQVGVGNAGAITSPVIDVNKVSTVVNADDGQTIVLGGLIGKSRIEESRRVPGLSRIPILGHLFRYDSDTKRRSELIIIMTPRILHDDDEIERLKAVESSRMSWCLADV
ncbi:MAG: hypothetical protein KDA75_07840, partial [Planctomycetaceae bacterium]|nr:hypothetical protein [Planctomycetaceae bacterium]